ncbi:MAG: single-stranded DNA-binding protein [Gemmatimonadota bacterium]|nr:single-stranded DNA-binding protein [Gemmatimonadota bacterium]
MARSLNKVMLIGNLGADPELRHTASGVAVATFSLATNWTRRTEDGETEENTEWHNVVVWRRLAEICQEYLQKGSKVYLEGRIQTRSWEDAKTGQRRYMTEVVANEMIMLDRPGGRRGAGVSEPAAQSHPDYEGEDQTPGGESDSGLPESDEFDDDLPF